MARDAFIIKRSTNWGVISYDILNHRFSYSERKQLDGEPYANQPVVLNLVLTRRCNMDCRHCVAQDFAGVEEEDLVVSSEMIRWINRSPFMLIVLTGGEPLMPPYDIVTMRLIESIKDRGIILDTNGTYLPTRKNLAILKQKKVMVRVSMDSASPVQELILRLMKKREALTSSEAYNTKLRNIARLADEGVFTAIQTVVWRKMEESRDDFDQMIGWMAQLKINRWYLQRLIPSHKFKDPKNRQAMEPEQYHSTVKRIAAKARRAGIECVPKMDLRHNSVFLLMADGVLYTQGAAPGQKVRLGTIHDELNYFDYVSPADHACRYYLPDVRPRSDRDQGMNTIGSLSKSQTATT